MELNPKCKAHKIQLQINELQKELVSHQEKCKHKNAEQKYGSNTGNYDPSSDCYWVNYYCPTCLKYWREDQ